MTAMDRVQSLKTRHTEVDSTLQMEMARPHPDDSRIADLKRQKLRIKDEIERLVRH
ncbi:MAG: DUF465 domain-containing protein [Alphaproteobacteria bacterium]|nr:DUF465 domain-containing protein [Alphaproteobacteria bacterium]TAD91867.1 MAG: DUF465 domain-containing protein [Alphaproteobacteria bacterium]